MEIPSDEESGPELAIEEQTAGMALEEESVAGNVDATPREGETREVVEEQELEKESKNRRKESKKRRRRVSLCRKSLDWRQRVPLRQSAIIVIQPL